MKPTILASLLLLAFAGMATATQYVVLTGDDQYTIDGVCLDLRAFNRSRATLAPAGDAYNSLIYDNASIVNHGGIMGDLRLYDHAIGHIEAGPVYDSWTYGDSRLYITGGQMRGHLWTRDQSYVQFSGGNHFNVWPLTDNTGCNVRVQFELFVQFDATVAFYGQSFERFDNGSFIPTWMDGTQSNPIWLQEVAPGATLQWVYPADANADNQVDALDLAVWQTHYDPVAETPGTYLIGDWNADGRVDGSDLALWQQYYQPLAPSGQTLTAIPEPNLVILATLALCAWGIYRRKRL